MARVKHDTRWKERAGTRRTKVTRMERRTKAEPTLPPYARHEEGKIERMTRRKPFHLDEDLDTFVRTLQRVRCSLFENNHVLDAMDPRTWDRCAEACLEQKASLVSIKTRVIRNLWEALQHEVEILMHLTLHPSGLTGLNSLGNFIRRLEKAWERKHLMATNLSWQEILGISKREVKQSLPLARCFLQREKALVRARLATIDMCSSRTRPNADISIDSSKDCTAAWNFRDNECTQLDHTHTGTLC